MDILEIFPIKILGEILDDISSKEIDSYKNFLLSKCEYKDFNKSLVKHTKNQQLLDIPLFASLKFNILKYSRILLDNLGKKYEDVRIVSSWGNIVNKGGEITSHHHNNSYLSGVFYLNNSTPIYFTDPSDKGYQVVQLENNEEIPSAFTIQPHSKLLLIFPSNLPHFVPVEENNSKMSIAFNIMPMGKISKFTAELNL